MKRLQLLLLLLLPSLMGQAANDMDKHLPANWGGWQNLSCSVNDTTYYTSDLLPMQAAVSGQTLHVFWPDWKPNAQGESCIYYRRSADAGRTWEDARAVVKAKSFSMVDINYAGGNFGCNSKWYAVEGQNVHLLTIVRSDDDQNSELLYTYSHDGGQTFQQRTLAKGSEGDGHYNYGRPHVVADGQTLVIAFGPDVEDVENIHRELILCKTCHGDDTVAKDILRRFLALFGIIPEDVQPFRLDPLDGEHLTAVAEGHQDGRDKRLAALGFAAQANDFTSWETGFMEHLEEKVHLFQLLVGSDAMGL